MADIATLERLARLGLRVFPLEDNGRRPLKRGWKGTPVRTVESLRGVFVDNTLGWPLPLNAAVATGQGVVVIDLDDKKGKTGSANFAALAEGKPLPDTFTVRTASGGRHLYFRTTREIANSAGRLGEGIDVRGDGGFVVAPGSEIDGRPYEIISVDDAIADLPEWLSDLLESPIRPASAVTDDLDTAGQVRRAREYLIHTAPEAVEGAAGDHTTFTVAARLKDLGVTETTALDLMLDHWNARCSPPWHPDELAAKVANAYRYSKNAPGSASPEADFPDEGDRLGSTDPMSPRPWSGRKPLDIAPRPWLMAPLLLKGKVSLCIAPPGVGKSTFTLALANALATGKDLAGFKVDAPCPTWLFNNEDDYDELDRRQAALVQHHGLATRDFRRNDAPALYLNSGEATPFIVAKRIVRGGAPVLVPNNLDALVGHLTARSIGCLIVDPFVETHEADENDNVEIAKVAKMYREVAQRADCAVLIVHHTRKPPAASSESYAGDMSSGRGAGSLAGVARVVFTLYPMSEKDAKRYHLPAEHRHKYVRFDFAKANLSALPPDPIWYEKVSVSLETETSRESVGILQRVTLTDFDDADIAAEHLGRDVLAVRDPRENPVSLADLGARLKDLAAYHDESPRTLTARLKTLDGRTIDGWLIALDETAKRSAALRFEPSEN